MKGYNQVATSSASPSMVNTLLIVSALAAMGNMGVSMWQVTYRDDGLAEYCSVAS